MPDSVLYNHTYDCELNGHIMDRWHPHSRTELHRTCVIPHCNYTEQKAASA